MDIERLESGIWIPRQPEDEEDKKTTEHFVFDHDEIVAEARWREPEDGWTEETCQHRAYVLRNHRIKRGLLCCHCGKRVSREELWKPPITGSGSPFVNLEDNDA